ncbi:hypothetical protein NQZ68_031504 [Dissostichus eleginoides]|nr:hypothetical protein NQZ68_031504 [Dissostichus eleginoides]
MSLWVSRGAARDRRQLPKVPFNEQPGLRQAIGGKERPTRVCELTLCFSGVDDDDAGLEVVEGVQSSDKEQLISHPTYRQDWI